VPVYLDSPLASNLTFEYSQNVFLNNMIGKDLFEFENLRFVKNTKKLIKNLRGPSIIIAGSGMCEGGRIVGHLINGLPNANNLLAIVGFQAEGTIGHELVKKPKSVTINKKNVQIQADIQEFYGFSAHADQKDLENWLNRFDRSRLQRVFLTHAEPDRTNAFIETANIKDLAYVPKAKEEVILN
jgi:metallo-beta-lactamase family protein